MLWWFVALQYTYTVECFATFNAKRCAVTSTPSWLRNAFWTERRIRFHMKRTISVGRGQDFYRTVSNCRSCVKNRAALKHERCLYIFISTAPFESFAMDILKSLPKISERIPFVILIPTRNTISKDQSLPHNPWPEIRHANFFETHYFVGDTIVHFNEKQCRTYKQMLRHFLYTPEHTAAQHRCLTFAN